MINVTRLRSICIESSKNLQNTDPAYMNQIWPSETPDLDMT